MGGTDDPSNLVELTIEEHAEAHRKLFEEHGCWEDEIAWKGLAGMITQEELIERKLSEAGKKGGKARIEKIPYEERRRISSLAAKANYAKNKEKIDAVLRENARRGAELGLGGYEAGKWIWITNGQESKKVLKAEQLPKGWRRGRHSRKST